MNTVYKRVAQLTAVVVPFMFAAPSSLAAESASPPTSSWPLIGLNPENHHFSLLKQINDGTVKDLGVAWYVDLPMRAGPPGVPLVVDGVIYQATQFSIVVASDLRTGKLLWTFDPKVTFTGDFPWIPSLAARFNRGVAIWEDKLYVATADGRLVAIDLKSGHKLWEADVCVGDNEFGITGAPRVGGGKVFIGPANMDNGTRRGFVDAYDAKTGKRLWRFYTIPGDPAKGFENKAMEMASKTWGKDYWKHTGGGSVVEGITFDPVTNLVYFGTSSATPDAPIDRGEDRGDELFAASIVAVNADTGEYVWHYQETPNNAWNYDSFAPISIAEVKIGGKQKRVLFHAPKNGYFYMLEARTGKLLAGDQYGVRVSWSSHIDMKTGRPVELPDAKYWLRSGIAKTFPTSLGAHNLIPMAYSPVTGLVYISAIDIPQNTSYTPRDKIGDITLAGGSTHFDLLGAVDKDARAPLIAWDPIKRKIAWKIDDPLPTGSGTLATAGNLVFYGRGDGLLRALAADTGKVLWSMNVPGAMRSTPITVEVDGEQVILLPIGSDGGGAAMVMGDVVSTEATRQAPARLVAFKLGGKAKLPELDISHAFQKPPLPRFPDSVAKHGQDVMLIWGCDYCHGGEQLQAQASSVPDLRKSNAGTHAALEQIVIGGALKTRGMPMFKDMPVGDLEAIRAFIVNSAWKAGSSRFRCNNIR